MIPVGRAAVVLAALSAVTNLIGTIIAGVWAADQVASNRTLTFTLFALDVGQPLAISATVLSFVALFFYIVGFLVPSSKELEHSIPYAMPKALSPSMQQPQHSPGYFVGSNNMQRANLQPSPTHYAGPSSTHYSGPVYPAHYAGSSPNRY